MQTLSLAPTRSFVLWRTFLILIITTLAFDLLFWKQPIGVNLMAYAFLIIAVLIARHGWNGLGGPARACGLGSMVAMFFVIWHHTTVSIIAGFISLFLFAAFAHEPGLRSIYYGIAQAVAGFFLTPLAGAGAVSEMLQDRRGARTGWRWFKLGIIPVLLLVVYFQIYRVANPKFDHFTAGFLDGLFGWFEKLFSNILTPHTIFLLFAFALSAALLLRLFPGTLARLEANWTDLLLRRRVKRPHWLAPLNMNALERERKVGLLLLVLLNALLVVVNVIDINWVWVGFEVPKDFSLKQFVHEGTWLLIISILLSMAIMLRLFNGNQNFYWRSRPLRLLVYAWIVQNFILGVSVFLRNYHYIHFHGLAYKRIGVIVFLVLVLVGLVTLYLKIRDRRSYYHLLRVNAWAAFAVLIGLTTVNWDVVITRYNLGHWNQGEIDVDNYLALSDKVLPLLYANKDKVEAQMEKHRGNEVVWIDRTRMQDFVPDLEAKRIRFLERWERTEWQGWNRADALTHARLEEMGLTQH